MPRGSVVISATNGKTTTAAMTASVLERAGIPLVHNRAGANMAGGVASTLLVAARAARSDRRRARAVRGRRVLARSARARARSSRACCSCNLFRDQLDRYGELETIADRWAAVVATLPPASPARAQRRRSADRRPRPRCARPSPTSASRIRRWRLPRDAARLGLQALPPLRRRLRVRRDLPRPSRPLPVPELRPAAAGADGRRGARSSSTGRRGATLPAAHARPARATVELPLPGLYNVYNALGAAALCLELGVALEHDRRRARGGAPPRSGGPRRSRIGDAELLDPAGQEPRRRQRDPADARARARRARRCSRSSTTGPPTAGTSRGCGTPTSSCSPRVCAASRARGRARRSWRCGSSTRASPVDRLRVVPGLAAGARRRAGRGRRLGRLFVLPTYTALLELRDGARRARARRASSGSRSGGA